MSTEIKQNKDLIKKIHQTNLKESSTGRFFHSMILDWDTEVQGKQMATENIKIQVNPNK